MARPRVDVDQNQFEGLCRIQCTESEICAYFGITDKTLNSWCKRVYKKGFSEIFEEKKGIGKVSLRRMQYRHAETNPAMAMFLGKQWLGQRDKWDTTVRVEKEDDPITKALKESLGDGTEL